jgi:hypothetical protein
MANHLYKNDLPDGLNLGPIVAIDCETMGLNPHRDRLCLVQMSGGDGDCHLVQVTQGQDSAPNLCAMLEDPAVLKLFHFGRFAECFRGSHCPRLLHQDRVKAGADLYGPPRAKNFAARYGRD